MVSRVSIALGLAWLFYSPLLAGESPTLYGIGRVGGPESPQMLYRLGPSGEAEAVGLLGLQSCDGLDFDPQGKLFTICERDGLSILAEVDPDTGAAKEQVVLTDPAVGRDRLTYTDLAFRRSDGTLFAFGLRAVHFGGVAPFPVAILYRLDQQTGRAAATQFLSNSHGGLAFEPREDILFTTETRGPSLQILDPWTGGADFSLPLEVGLDYYNLDFGPDGRELWGVYVRDLNESVLVTLDVITGAATTRVALPVEVSGIAWADGRFPPNRETVVPLLNETPLAGGRRISSSLALFNSSTTTVQATLEFYDADGNLRPPVLPAGGLSGPIGRGRVARFDLSEALDGFTGWGSLQTAQAGELGATATISLDDGSLALRADPLAQVRLGAVVPARRFSAAALIEANRESAFTVVNPSRLRTAVVRVRALRDDGSVLDLNEIRIHPRGQVSGLLWRLLLLGKVFVQPPERPEFQGQVIFESVAPVAVTGVQVTFSSGSWASIPLERTVAP